MELKLQNIGKRYRKEWVLRDINLKARDGEVILILGQNSAGKSTLLKILGTVVKPTVGNYEIDGEDILKSPSNIRGRISFVPEDPPLVPELSVDENLEFYSWLYGYKGDFHSLKKRFGIIFSDKPCRYLSKGMKQRMSLAISQMIVDPLILLLDEPTNELDLETVAITKDLISEMASRGVMVFIASHDEDLVSVVDRVVILEGGRKVFDAEVNEVMEKRLVEIEADGERKYVPSKLLTEMKNYKVVRIVGIRESLELKTGGDRHKNFIQTQREMG